MKRLLSFLGTALLALPARAQDYTDALRYSMLSPQGTARSIGFGGALGSVGADFTALSVNPAGIGLYRRSELSFTPSIRFGGVKGSYLGNTRDESYGGFNISNFGIVGTNQLDGRGGWQTVSFGVGINRMADFNRDYSYSGVNTTSSAGEAFALDANARADASGNIPENSFGDLGYQAFIVNKDSLGYYSPLQPYNAKYGDALRQTRSVTERGGISELLFDIGGNYNEHIMLGATLGVPLLRYVRNATYTEVDANNTYPNFDNFTYSETLKTTGAGVNIKLGIILKPSDGFRFGAAIHTPTWYSLTDEVSQSIVSSTTDGGANRQVPAVQSKFSYDLLTPWRGVLSATGFFGNVGFISADYEYVDYRSARFNFNTDENKFLAGSGAFAASQQIANDSIRNRLQGASNVRIGGEAHMGGLFFRAGYGFYGNPYRSSPFDAARTDISAGIGFRGAKGFIDLGFVHTEYSSSESPYVLAYSSGTIAPVARLENTLNNLAITVGVKF